MATPPSASPDQPAFARASRVQWALVLILLAIHAVTAWRVRPPILTPQSNDDGLYLLLSRSLRHLKYVDTHVVGMPYQAQYPPGYPAILAVTGALFGDGLNVAHATTILMSALGLLVLFDLARRLIGPWPALALLGALALNNQLLEFSSSLASEQPYIALSMLTLWAAVALPEGPRRIWVVGMTSILAALTRSVGIALVAAVLLLWLLERRYRAATAYALAAGVTVGAWMLWTFLAPNQFLERSYAAVMSKPRTAHPGLLDSAWTRCITFFKTYIAGSAPAGLEVPTIPGTVIDNAIWLGLILGLGSIGLLLMWRRARLLSLYITIYCVVLMVYPFKLTRFYLPLVPLELLAMLVGVTWLSRRWPRVALPLSLVITLPIMASTARSALTELAEAGRCRRVSTPTNPQCFPPAGRAFLAAVRYAADSLPPGSAVLTIKESPFYYYTGHRVMHPQLPVVKARDHVLSYITERGVYYIVLSAYPGGGLVAGTLGADCHRLEQLFAVEPWTYVLRVQRPGEPPPRVDGCAAVTEATLHTRKSGHR
jgi:hypothetical protein